MGIQGLLPVLKPITNTVHVSKYRGQKVAVDAYCWLHKAAYCCAEEICEGRFTDKHVQYCMQKVQMLQHSGVQPVIVFDGGRLPMKAAEEGSRSRARKENRDKATAHVKAGNKQAANECYQRAVDISPATANDFARALKAAGVEFIVAPFEADAQMAYLAVNGLVHSVITEDSDLLPYGCPRVLFKMDKAGEGQEIVAADLAQNRDPSFVGFTHQMFLEMCIFAGCDFLKALPGIGTKKAHQHVKRLKAHRKVCKSLRFSGVSVPRDYEQGFQRALWTFQHQRVWCPQRKQLVHLHPLPQGGLAAVDAVVGALAEGDTAHDFLGPVQPDAVMQKVAEGELDPITLEPFPQPAAHIPPQVNPRGTSTSLHQMGSWRPQRRSSDGKQSGGRRPLTLPVQANGITSYFPTLPSNEETLRQFSAPRPAAKTTPLRPFSRHYCLGKRSKADAAATDEVQPSASGRLGHVTSPAGKASRHLSGCGSQPELPQHAFSAFTSGKRCSALQKSRPAGSPAPDKTDSCLAHVDSSNSAAVSILPARSCAPDQTDTPAAGTSSSSSSAALANLLARGRMATQTDSPMAGAITNPSADLAGRPASTCTPARAAPLAGALGRGSDPKSTNGLQHAFSIFAAGRGGSAEPPSRLADTHTVDQSDSPATTPSLQESKSAAVVQSSGSARSGQGADWLAVQPSADGNVDPGGSASAAFYSTSPGGLEPDNSPANTHLPAKTSPCPVKQDTLPSKGPVSPFQEASRASWERQSTIERPARRKVSSHFGSLPARHSSVVAGDLPSAADPCGVLGGLVSKLQPQRSPSDLDSSTNEDFEVDLGTSEGMHSGCMQDDAAGHDRGADSVEEEDGPDSHMHHTPIAGLEHIQPFASIANVAVTNVAVTNVTAAALKKFGMQPQKAVAKGHARTVLQPFAPPRRRNAPQELQQQSGRKWDQGTPLSLKQFACSQSS